MRQNRQSCFAALTPIGLFGLCQAEAAQRPSLHSKHLADCVFEFGAPLDRMPFSARVMGRVLLAKCAPGICDGPHSVGARHANSRIGQHASKLGAHHNGDPT